MRIGRLWVDKELTISDLFKLSELSDYKADLLREKKTFWFIKSYAITKRMIKILCTNRFVFFFDINKLQKLLNYHKLGNENEKSKKTQKIKDALSGIVAFFAVNLKKTPVEIERDTRERDIVTLYNTIIIERIKKISYALYAHHSPELTSKTIKELEKSLLPEKPKQKFLSEAENEDRNEIENLENSENNRHSFETALVGWGKTIH